MGVNGSGRQKGSGKSEDTWERHSQQGKAEHNSSFASELLSFVTNDTAFGFRRQVTRERSIHDPEVTYCERIWIKSFLKSSTKC